MVLVNISVNIQITLLPKSAYFGTVQQIQTQPMLPDTEVSEVSSLAPEPMSQDTTTSEGESFKSTEAST